MLAILLLLSGCGRSVDELSGVYKTEEIKKEIKGTRSAYFASTWTLDLSEAKSFTLNETKLRKHLESKKYADLPVDGENISGEWKIEGEKLVLTTSLFLAPEVYKIEAKDHIVLMPFTIQSNGDLVSDSDATIEIPGFSIEVTPEYFKGLRFKQ